MQKKNGLMLTVLIVVVSALDFISFHSVFDQAPRAAITVGSITVIALFWDLLKEKNAGEYFGVIFCIGGSLAMVAMILVQLDYRLATNLLGIQLAIQDLQKAVAALK